jgi:cell division septation protein DedD
MLPIRLAPVQEVMRMSLQDTKGDGLQATKVASVQEAINSIPKNDYAKEQDESEGNFVVKDSISRSHNRGFVIQVGAFRSLVRAEKLQKELQDKGYDAYLETRALPNHEPFHRVRIRGYMSLVDARAEMEHLLTKEGLDSFALPMESTLP